MTEKGQLLPVVILGGGGHAKVVADMRAAPAGRSARSSIPRRRDRSFSMRRSCVPLPNSWTRRRGFRSRRWPPSATMPGGDEDRRGDGQHRRVAIAFAVLLHPTASIAGDVTLGAGTVVMAQVAVNPASTLGRHVIVNTHASIDHDCRIGDFVSIGPGAVLGGEVSVGRGAAVGMARSCRTGSRSARTR